VIEQKNRPADSWASAIPAELKRVQQWIGWMGIIGEGQPVSLPGGQTTKPLKVQAKPHKLPINPRTGGLAASTRKTTWSSFTGATTASREWLLTGIGFVFSDEDPYAGVDIDNCRNPETGEIAEWAWTVIQTLDSYTEVSPSGTGVHLILRATVPAGQGNQAKLNGGKVEIFSRARYFTFTGVRVDGTPTEIRDRQSELDSLHADLFAKRVATAVHHRNAVAQPNGTDAELIERARRAKNGGRFDRLWAGQWEADYP
jgi:putative DNA primase/helicase